MDEQQKVKSRSKLTPVWRVVMVVAFIIFLLYSTLLIREFEHSENAQDKGLLRAIQDIFTLTNFTIAVVSSVIGYLVFEFLRNKIS